MQAFVRFMYIKLIVLQREKKREREKLMSDSSHRLVHYLNANSGWAGLKPGARNSTQVSHLYSKNSASLTITYCLPESTLLGS